MGEQDVLNVHFLLPQAQIVAVHMEAINHCLLTRHALREYAEANQFSDALSIPRMAKALYSEYHQGKGETDAASKRRDCRGGRV
jgi:hypothetical protein